MFLLLEDGDNLLLEDGTAYLLDGTVVLAPTAGGTGTALWTDGTSISLVLTDTGTITGYGYAYDAIAGIIGTARGAGIAYGPTVKLSERPSTASGTGAAYAAKAPSEVHPLVATGTGFAYNAQIGGATGDIGLLAETASGTGVAYQPAVSIAVTLVAANVVGGFDPLNVAGEITDTNAVAFDDLDVVVIITSAHGVATGFGYAYPATAATVTGITPTTATGTGTAYWDVGDSLSVELTSQYAITGYGYAYDATILVTPDVPPFTQLDINVETATGTGTAYQPTLVGVDLLKRFAPPSSTQVPPILPFEDPEQTWAGTRLFRFYRARPMCENVYMFKAGSLSEQTYGRVTEMDPVAVYDSTGYPVSNGWEDIEVVFWGAHEPVEVTDEQAAALVAAGYTVG